MSFLVLRWLVSTAVKLSQKGQCSVTEGFDGVGCAPSDWAGAFLFGGDLLGDWEDFPETIAAVIWWAGLGWWSVVVSLVFRSFLWAFWSEFLWLPAGRGCVVACCLLMVSDDVVGSGVSSSYSSSSSSPGDCSSVSSSSLSEGVRPLCDGPSGLSVGWSGGAFCFPCRRSLGADGVGEGGGEPAWWGVFGLIGVCWVGTVVVVACILCGRIHL
jgi:hypothetical protein